MTKQNQPRSPSVRRLPQEPANVEVLFPCGQRCQVCQKELTPEQQRALQFSLAHVQDRDDAVCMAC